MGTDVKALIIIILLILIALFYPLCGFKSIGSQSMDECNTCICTPIGEVCTLKDCINIDQEYCIEMCTERCRTSGWMPHDWENTNCSGITGISDCDECIAFNQ